MDRSTYVLVLNSSKSRVYHDSWTHRFRGIGHNSNSRQNAFKHSYSSISLTLGSNTLPCPWPSQLMLMSIRCNLSEWANLSLPFRSYVSLFYSPTLIPQPSTTLLKMQHCAWFLKQLCGSWIRICHFTRPRFGPNLTTVGTREIIIGSDR